MKVAPPLIFYLQLVARRGCPPPLHCEARFSVPFVHVVLSAPEIRCVGRHSAVSVSRCRTLRQVTTFDGIASEDLEDKKKLSCSWVQSDSDGAKQPFPFFLISAAWIELFF